MSECFNHTICGQGAPTSENSLVKELPIMPTGPGHRLDTRRMHTISVDYDIEQMPVFLPLCNAFKFD